MPKQRASVTELRENAASKAAAAVPGQISPDMAELLSQKIREMEQSSASEKDRQIKEKKGRARAAAKTKLKEAKRIMADTEMSSEEKIRALGSSLQSEHDLEVSLRSQAQARMQELENMEISRRSVQSDLNRSSEMKNKLESLCRQLRRQSDALMEERRRLTDIERHKRAELADEYQHTIEDVKKKMDEQAAERGRLARENEELRQGFKDFFARYDQKEKDLLDRRKDVEAEIVELNAKFDHSTNACKEQVKRETIAQCQFNELSGAETKLRAQLQTYSTKFNDFQEALSKSDRVLGQYRRQKSKMERKTEVLEKENREMRVRNDKRIAALQKDREMLAREKDALQEKCKKLQGERQKLLQQSAVESKA